MELWDQLMAVYSTRDFIGALLRKGFRQDQTHRRMFWFYVDGKKTSVRARTSHGELEFGESMLGVRGKQIGLTKRQALDFIRCPLGKAELQELLIASGRVRRQE